MCARPEHTSVHRVKKRPNTRSSPHTMLQSALRSVANDHLTVKVRAGVTQYSRHVSVVPTECAIGTFFS